MDDRARLLWCFTVPIALDIYPSSGVPATPMQFSKDLPFTPAVGTKGGNAIMGMSTCLRLPRRGESILNARGSPIGTFKHDTTAQLIMDDQNKIASMAVGVGDETVDFADPAVRQPMQPSMFLQLKTLLILT